tara:strand:- start:237 stop:1037 length:801 start_codon:yes stop_codon:yes gene_type:complete
MAVIGSPPGAFPQLTITQSQTWVPPQDGTVCIHVVGAGGGGMGHASAAYGGGSGAYGKIPTLAVTTSGSYALVVGGGGAAGMANNSAANGGASTVAGTGLTGTKTCNGGTGGRWDGSAYVNGSGGTVGGSGESWAGYQGGNGNTGGGAVGVFATGQAGQASGAARSGGMTDAQSGGLAMSGYGIICGGSSVSLTHYYGSTGYDPVATGADLCGGGGVEYAANRGEYMFAGAGGIGGGGGGCRNTQAGSAIGGRGGDGIILIQYLPW